jgi:hypothetical protein
LRGRFETGGWLVFGSSAAKEAGCPNTGAIMPLLGVRAADNAIAINRRRPHSSLGCTTPDQAYFEPLPIRMAA